MRILAVDPGNTTGIAVWSGGPKPHVIELPGGFPALVDWMRIEYGTSSVQLSTARPDLVIVEDWVINDETHEKTRQPDAMYGCGYIYGKAIEWGLQVLTPSAGQHKPRTGVKKLRRDGLSDPIKLGWAKRTSDRHGEDACSLLLFGLREYDRPTYDAVMATILPHVDTP